MPPPLKGIAKLLSLSTCPPDVSLTNSVAHTMLLNSTGEIGAYHSCRIIPSIPLHVHVHGHGHRNKMRKLNPLELLRCCLGNAKMSGYKDSLPASKRPYTMEDLIWDKCSMDKSCQKGPVSLKRMPGQR